MWGGDVFKAVYAVAFLAIEMNVHVIGRAVPVAVAQFVFRNAPAILDRVNYIVLKQYRQHSRYTRAVDGFKVCLKLYEA